MYVAGDAVIECTERVYVEELVLELPGGVTLASDRGIRGAPGGLIRSDTFATRPLIRVTGPDARVTGLRLQGPNPRQCLEHHSRAFREDHGGHRYYYKFPTSGGVQTEEYRLSVDNCELAGWSHGAVYLAGGDGHRVQHCFDSPQPVPGPRVRRQPRPRRVTHRGQPLRRQPPLHRRLGA